MIEIKEHSVSTHVLWLSAAATPKISPRIEPTTIAIAPMRIDKDSGPLIKAETALFLLMTYDTPKSP